MDAMVTEEAFSEEATAFLEGHVPRRSEHLSGWGMGSDEIPVIDDVSPEQERKELAAARRWQATLFDAGYGWIDGPRQYGGGQLPTGYAHRFAALTHTFEIPKQDTLLVSLRIITRALALHGSDELKARFLAKLTNALENEARSQHIIVHR